MDSPLTSPLSSVAKVRAKKRSLLALMFLVLSSLAIDQTTKIAAERNLMVWADHANLKEYQGRRFPIWSTGEDPLSSPTEPPFYLSFNFNYVRNQGAAWGALSEWDDQFRIPFFYAVTLFAVIIIVLYLRSTPAHHRLARFALTLILSGALGNFLDRILRGYVIDFLDCRWTFPLPFPIHFKIDYFPAFLNFLNFEIDANAWHYNFPNFNWADSMITVGVSLLIYDMLVLEYLRKRQHPADKPAEGQV